MYVLEEKTRDLKKKHINDHEKVLNRDSAYATKKNPGGTRRVTKNEDVENDFRKFLDHKKSNSQLNGKQTRTLYDS